MNHYFLCRTIYMTIYNLGVMLFALYLKALNGNGGNPARESYHVYMYIYTRVMCFDMINVALPNSEPPPPPPPPDTHKNNLYQSLRTSLLHRARCKLYR